MEVITAKEYFEENVIWNGTIIMNPCQLMEGYYEYKLIEAKINEREKWENINSKIEKL